MTVVCVSFFFFKQKTAYEMRISDWRSDVCSSDLIASAMAAEHAADNQQTLEAQLGRNVTSTDLYLAHFLGVGGAAKFLRAHDQNPGASAAAVLPSAASANRWVFYDRNGAPRSLAEVRQRFAEKLEIGRAHV